MRTSKLAVILIAVASAIRLVLGAVIPLFPDETYYWEWSRHLAAGYFDHPPAVALLIRAGTAIFGPTALGVRIGAVLAGAVASLAVVVIAQRLSSEDDAADDDTSANALDDPGARAALLMLVIPGALAGFLLATPDAPLLAAIALTLAALERAIASPPRSQASLGWWCAAGIALGLAFCSKLTSVLIPAGVLIALLSRRDLRIRLAEPGPYVSVAIALLVLSPTLVWNSRHEWISFAFQLHHGLGETHGSALVRELSLIGGQLGLISPIIAVMAAIAVAQALRSTTDPRRFLLAVVATTVAAVFVVSAFRRPVEPNWPVPALVAAIPLLATLRLRRRLRSWLAAGAVLGAVCVVILAVQGVSGVFHFPSRRDPVSRAYGWNELASSVERAQLSARQCSAVWLAADRYQDASELAFHLPSKPRVFALNLGGRPNQYDMWNSIYSLAAPSDCALVVVDEGPAGQHVVQRLGAASMVLVSDAVMTWRGIPVRRRAIWLVRGIPSAPPLQVELSPIAKAALAAATSTFPPHLALLDSIVSIYSSGPIPNVVTATTTARVSNSDRQASINAKLRLLQPLLLRAGFKAVYRDARYRDCTFVRSTEPDSTDIGYVYTPEGCKLAAGIGDRLLQVDHASGPWYSYASPERRN